MTLAQQQHFTITDSCLGFCLLHAQKLRACALCVCVCVFVWLTEYEKNAKKAWSSERTASVHITVHK